MKRILLIEDEKNVRDNLVEMLELNGFETLSAGNGRIGLCVAQRELPDLILCDIMMPELNGYEVLEAIRDYPPTAHIPLIFLTALADNDDVRLGMNLGADDYLTKPCTEDEVIGAIRGRMAREAARAALKILVIEDEEAARSNLVDLLEIHEFKVIAAENGREGVSLAASEFPDLVLCDVMMPEFDGYEVLEAVHSHGPTAQIPFIFLTALAEKSEVRRGMNLGADDYLTKPFSEDDIIGAIHSRLRKQMTVLAKYEEVSRQIHLLRNYDSATGLPNYSLVKVFLDREIKWAQRKKSTLAVIALSPELLNSIATPCSNRTRDLLMKEITERLNIIMFASDTLVRVSDSQFILILPLDNELPSIDKIARKIMDSLAQPFRIDKTDGCPVGCICEEDISLASCMGISFLSALAENADSLVNQANTALHYAMNDESERYLSFNQTMQAIISESKAIQEGLLHALEKKEFLLHYQPQVNLDSGKIVGVEALIRWQHPQKGFISPLSFIPIAEKTGIILPIGEWVLYEACRQMKTWCDQGFSGLTVAVNLSPVQLKQKDAVQVVSRVLKETGLDPKNLALEPTESILIRKTEEVIAKLQILKNMGIQIAIDDFGTGYSSLSNLKYLPLSKLKIDQSFVRDITTNPNSLAIAQAIIALGRSLNLTVVAEGVETSEQCELLGQYGCEEIQGYYFSKPVDAKKITALLEKDREAYSARHNPIF